MVRVVVADGGMEERRSLIQALALDDRFHIDGHTDNGFEAVLLVEDMRPDFIVMDLLMPLMTGYTAIPEIHKCSPRTKVVVYSTVSLAPEEIARLGVDFYVSKTETSAEALVGRLCELSFAA